MKKGKLKMITASQTYNTIKIVPYLNYTLSRLILYVGLSWKVNPAKKMTFGEKARLSKHMLPHSITFTMVLVIYQSLGTDICKNICCTRFESISNFQRKLMPFTKSYIVCCRG